MYHLVGRGQQGTLGNPASVGLCQPQVLETLSNVVIQASLAQWRQKPQKKAVVSVAPPFAASHALHAKSLTLYHQQVLKFTYWFLSLPRRPDWT